MNTFENLVKKLNSYTTVYSDLIYLETELKIKDYPIEVKKVLTSNAFSKKEFYNLTSCKELNKIKSSLLLALNNEFSETETFIKIKTVNYYNMEENNNGLFNSVRFTIQKDKNQDIFYISLTVCYKTQKIVDE